MRRAPKLSIIIPAYNCGQRIKAIVNSIVEQSFTDWELIIVDDKSIDNTAAVLANIAKTDRRIKILSQTQNGGASVARNAGIAQARGQYLMFFDADDNITSDMLDTFIEAIDQQPVDLAVSGFTVNTLAHGKTVASVDVCTEPLPSQKDEESFPLYILRLLGLDGRLYQVWNKIYRASIINDNNIKFQPGVNFGEDLVFNLHYFSHMTRGIAFIPRAFYQYNQSVDSGTFSKSSLVYTNRQANYDELVKFVADIPASTRKVSLLSWIQYDWLYSHLLAVSQSSLPAQQKITNIQNVAREFAYPPFSEARIIGKKRVQIERMLSWLLKHPRIGLRIIYYLNSFKNNRFTAVAWRRLRQAINH